MSKSKPSKCIPHTSRTTDKMLEYYTNYGKDRNLEKFMRLYSPADSQNSQQGPALLAQAKVGNTSDNSETILESLRKMALRVEKEKIKSQSLPNVSYLKFEHGLTLQKMENENSEEVLIPIRIENPTLLTGSQNSKVTLEDASNPELSDDVRTPTQKRVLKNQHTQTPESVAKTHRRLEWDSLADIGYVKSMSTGNLSTLERTLLKEMFREGVSKEEAKLEKKLAIEAMHLNITPRVIAKTVQQTQQIEAIPADKSCTPPLACSTLVAIVPNVHTKSKLRHQSTSTTKVKQHEKYAQTSLPHCQIKSNLCQEVQVNLSSNGSSVLCASATPSSFEYFSSHSGTSHEHIKRNVQLNKNGTKATDITKEPHPLAAEIDRLFLKGKKSNENQQTTTTTSPNTTKAQKISKCYSSRCDKENFILPSSSAASSSSCSEQLELGVQLLCSLIDARDINSKRKKLLVQSIVQRITRLSAGSDSVSSLTEAERSSIASHLAISIEKLQKRKKLAKKQAKQNLHKVSNATMKQVSENRENLSTAKRDLTQAGGIEIDPKEAETKNAMIHSSKSDSCYVELTRQKDQVNSNITNSDAEQPTMQEWLNPMTQSEVEYEERRREYLKNKSKPSQLLHANTNENLSTDDTEHQEQLQFVQNEIERLQLLQQHLSQKVQVKDPNRQVKSERDNKQSEIKLEVKLVSAEQNAESTSNSNSSEFVYETVNCTNSADQKGCYSKKIGNLEVTLNMADTGTNSSSSKKSAEHASKRSVNGTKKKDRVFEFDIVGAKPSQNERSKMATPVDETGSLQDYAAQRKYKFLKNYQLAKQQEQQRNEEHYRLQDYKSRQVKVGDKPTEVVAYHHYSVPHTMYRCVKPMIKHHHHHCHYTTHLSPTYAALAPPATTAAPASDHFYLVPTNAAVYTTASSSASMRPLSSDISVPMGSQENSTSTTTTHQYDDVAITGAPINSSSSITKNVCPKLQRGISCKCITSAVSCVQKQSPQNIAYTVQFNGDKKTTPSTTTAAKGTIVDVGNVVGKSENSPYAAIWAPSQQTAITLQKALELRRPDFIANSKKRKDILNEMQALRQERARELRQIVENSSCSENVDWQLRNLPPAPILKVKIFNTLEMRAITRKRCSELPEVLQRQQHEREARRRRGNRVMQHVFSRRLLQRVRSGLPSLNHTGAII